MVAALCYHGVLSIFGTYRNTYDAYVHIFFADHWRRGWFDHWDPRWYTGFTLTSYPPGSQQSVAMVSFHQRSAAGFCTGANHGNGADDHRHVSFCQALGQR